MYAQRTGAECHFRRHAAFQQIAALLIAVLNGIESGAKKVKVARQTRRFVLSGDLLKKNKARHFDFAFFFLEFCIYYTKPRLSRCRFTPLLLNC